MTKSEFVQQVVIATLPTYLNKTKEVSIDFSRAVQRVPLTTKEAHTACVQDALALAETLVGWL